MGKQSGRGQVKNFIRAARGGCLAHLWGTNKTCIDLTRGGGGGGRKITRLLPIHYSGTSHVHYLNVWKKMAITQSCCHDYDVRLFPSVPEMTLNKPNV